MNPKISVVMSVYEGETYLREAIESILNQTFKDFEFIIINDGSTDQSWSIIHEYAEKDQRIVPVIQDNIGLTKSLNKGISMAEGEYIARMDADDMSLPIRFETQLPWLEEKGYDLCCSRTWLIEENRVSPGLTYYLPRKWLLNFRNPFIHGTYLMKKTALDGLGGYDEEFLYGQDYKLIRDFYEKDYRVKYLKEPLYQTRELDDSIGIKNRKEQLEMKRRLQTYFPLGDLKKIDSESNPK
jgi:glycosyltransferase involved in cell wall biosynthesis